MADIVQVAGGLIIGVGIGVYIRQYFAKRSLLETEEKAKTVVSNAESKASDILKKANDESLIIMKEAKKDEAERRSQLQRMQERVEKREAVFDQKLLAIEEERDSLKSMQSDIDTEKEKVVSLREKSKKELEQVAGLSSEEAKDKLFEKIEADAESDLLARRKKMEARSAEELERESRTMLATAMQRYAGTHVTETTTTVVALPSEDMKGRIIGKEGRNIKALELLTGVDIVIDDTPNSLLISGFNPLRRHVAKRAIEKLMADGRIQPAKIEEAVKEAKEDISEDMRRAGEDALQEVGVIGLDPKLVQILGRLKYRTSYGQNVLRHSIEVALISEMLAEELGANVMTCKKGGILHDIGKAIDHEVKGGHPEIGYEIMKKFGLPEEIAYLSIAHHETHPKTLEGIICLIADKVSGGRPGARKDSLEEYIGRLQDLEHIADRRDGVQKSFAISAGRELRVIVNSKALSDTETVKLAKDIASDIESELQYPGDIKVNVIRENRVIEYAR